MYVLKVLPRRVQLGQRSQRACISMRRLSVSVLALRLVLLLHHAQALQNITVEFGAAVPERVQQRVGV